MDHLFGIVVSIPDCHPRGPRFDSWLYPRHFSGSIGSGTESIQPREDNWVATLYEKRNQVKKTEIKVEGISALLTTRPPVLQSGSNHFSQSWLFGAVAPRIYCYFYTGICDIFKRTIIHSNFIKLRMLRRQHPEFNEVRVNKKTLISYYYYHIIV